MNATNVDRASQQQNNRRPPNGHRQLPSIRHAWTVSRASVPRTACVISSAFANSLDGRACAFGVRSSSPWSNHARPCNRRYSIPLLILLRRSKEESSRNRRIFWLAHTPRRKAEKWSLQLELASTSELELELELAIDI